MSPWIWIAGGIAVAALEMVATGVFLLWIGLAGAAVGLILFVSPGLSVEAQFVVFAILAVAAAFVGQAAYRRLRDTSDRPALNRRGEQLVGRRAVLEQPIVDGVGRIRIDDTTWRVSGPDLAAGTHVKVVEAFESVLRVAVAE